MEAKYAVLTSFTDLEDDEHLYLAGKDHYPRDGYTPTDGRITQLQGAKNKLKKPIISKEPVA